MTATRFSVADYAVFGTMLAVSAAIGVYYAVTGAKKGHTSKELLVGGRSLSAFPVALSVLASFLSAITLLGTPAEIYQFGTLYWYIVVSYFLVIPVTAYLYMPTFHRLGIISVFEYLELRFSRLVRTLGSLTFSVNMLLYMAVVLYAPSLALAQVTGLAVWVSVASIGIVCTFYTSLGGIKAVVVTDVFQVIMMFISMIVVVFKGAADLGGWQHVWKINMEGQRIEFFNFDLNPTTRHTVWSLVIGGYFTWLSIYGVNQTMVQRYLAIPTVKGARRAIWINLPAMSTIVSLTCLCGLVLYAKYHDCDPKAINVIQAPDQILPLFVMETLGFIPGLPGLFVAGIFSGALSTISSGMNSLAAVTLEDLIRVYIKPDLSELWAARTTKILAVAFGILSIVLVAIAEQLGNVLQAALSLIGMLGGPVLGIFSLGLFFPWANATGTTVGLLSGLAMSFWVGFGAAVYKPRLPKLPISTSGCFLVPFSNATNGLNDTLADFGYQSVVQNITNVANDSDGFMKLYSLSYMWYSATGFGVCVVIGLIVSFLTGATKPEDINENLICPVFDILCPYLPKSLRKKLRFNVGKNYRKSSSDVPSEKQAPSIGKNGYTNNGYETTKSSTLTIQTEASETEKKSAASDVCTRF